MSQLQAKQVKRILSGWVKVTGLSISGSTSTLNVTSTLTSALAIAGDNNTAVALLPSTNTSENGVIVTSPNNKSEIYDNVTKDKIANVNSEVYGKITYTSGIYTLGFFYLDGTGAEQAYTFPATKVIDFDFGYRYLFHQAPADIAISLTTKSVMQDPRGATGIEFKEQLFVTALNTLSTMANIPSNSSRVELSVNGKIEDSIGSSASFSVSTNVINWSPSNAGYNLETSDRVIVKYYV